MRVWSAAVLLAITLSGGALQAQNERPAPSDAPFTAEQLAVYRAFFQNWKGDGPVPLRLSAKVTPYTSPLRLGVEGCETALQLEPAAAALTQSFRPEDLSAFGLTNAYLSDSTQPPPQPKGSRPKHLSVSEIRFDRQHKHALLQFSFRCGPMCGNGATLLFEKKNGRWTRKTECQNWISYRKQCATWSSSRSLS